MGEKSGTEEGKSSGSHGQLPVLVDPENVFRLVYNEARAAAASKMLHVEGMVHLTILNAV